MTYPGSGVNLRRCLLAGDTVDKRDMIFPTQQEAIMKCPRCVEKTAKKAARAVVIAVAVPVALCCIGILCRFMGDGNIKDC